jgi:hypothetical protein
MEYLNEVHPYYCT